MKRVDRRIAFLPETDGNPYISRMRDLLSGFGTLEKPKGLKAAIAGVFTARFKLHDIVWLNFTDNEIIDAGGHIRWYKTCRLFFRTAVMCGMSNQSIFVRHNHYPHATIERQAKLAKRIVDTYEKLFDRVVTLSGAEVTPLKSYCPHPLYELVNENEADQDLLASLPEKYYIVFGRIMRYKKLDELIRVFPKNKMLVIAGSVGDKDYLAEISRDLPPNVILIPKRISEASAQAMVRNSQAMVISHAGEDMVVSASFFYAMSVGQAVHTVRTDFFTWIAQQLPTEVLQVSDSIEVLANRIECEGVVETDFPDSRIQDLFGDDRVVAAIENIIR